MADSFFGFNTSLDEIDDGGAFEASEDEYDALNDETFGEMVDDGDWEQQHEEFSLLTENSKHMDIEETLSNLMLDNDEGSPSYSNQANRHQQNLPLSQIPSLPNLPPLPSMKNICTVEELERSLRQQPPQHQQQQQQQNVMPPMFPPRFPGMMPPPPMMGNPPFPGQPMPFRMQQPPPPNHYGNFNMMPPNNMPPGGGPLRPPMPPGMDQHPPGFHQMHFNQQPPPNNFNGQQQQRFPMNNQPPPMPHGKFPMNQQQQQQFPPPQRFPPNQQFPMNQQQQPGPMHQPMPPNHHLNQQQQPQQRIPHNQQQMNNRNQPHPGMNQMHKPNNNNRPFPNSFNNSNGPNKAQNDTNNLIQMIQNTHPMLQNNMHSGYMNAFIANPLLARGIIARHLNNMPPGFNQMQNNRNDNQRRPNPDADPYSGLMSTREKQWLLNIQMMQLNTGTPYIDDFYYTVFLERKNTKQKEVVKEAHKMNQENHPFSQKNLQSNRFHQYNNNHGNEGEHRRERCNSTRSNSDNPPQNKDGPRIYVPTQFENSLGKLQCGSVTAPRKIIDMEVIGRESPTGEVRNNAIGSSTAGVIGAPRGTRHILLAIETLYRILLRLEDLSEPLAIANAVVLKEREEKQKAALLEQMQMDKDDDDSPGESGNNFLRDIESVHKQKSEGSHHPGPGGNSILPTPAPTVLPNLLDENKPDLIAKLFAGLLFEDRLSSFMNIRKGKMLVIRILAQAVPTERWRAPLGRVWPRLLRAFPYALRRDTSMLNQLVDHFQQYLNGTEGWAPVSDLCLMLAEESTMPVSNPRGSSVPFRSNTPSLPSRSLMHFIMSTTLGLSMIVILMERASVLPKPAPAAWNNMVKCAGRLVAGAGAARPLNPLPKSLLSAHCAAADLAPGIEESLIEVLA